MSEAFMRVLWAGVCLVFAGSALAAVPPQFSIVAPLPQQSNVIASTNLVVGNDGNLYGATYTPTAGGHGTGCNIFRVTPNAGTLTTIYSFPGPIPGTCDLSGPLVVGGDGALYGVNGLSIFRLTTDGGFATFATIPYGFYTSPYFGLLAASDGSFYAFGQDLNGIPDEIYHLSSTGSAKLIQTLNTKTQNTSFTPYNMIQGFDGNIYGVTSNALFTILPGDVFNVLATLPLPSDPSDPAQTYPYAVTCGSGIVQSSDGNFYCWNDVSQYAGAYSLLGLTPTGQMSLYKDAPNYLGNLDAPLTLGADGNLYGVSYTNYNGETYAGGGISPYCDIYQLTNTGQLSLVYNTPAGACGNNDEVFGFTGLVLAPDGTLYGAATESINYPNGYVFKLGPGTGGSPVPLSFISPALLDAQPTFVSTSSVNSNPSGLVATPSLLIGGGRPVVGAAADGVTRVLLRAVVNGNLTYSLADENMNPIGSSTEYGGLLPATGGGASFANSVQVQPNLINGREMAFVAYRAPMDFVRSDPNFNANDQMAVSRTVNVQIATPDGTVLTTYPITLVRPPVVVIHGITSEPKYWDTFTPLVSNCAAPTVSGDPRFFVLCADWSKKVPGVVNIDPNYLGLGSFIMTFQPIRQNVLGYAYNAPVVFSQMQNAVANYSLAAPTAGNLPIASVQVDAVGHSMGNLVARTMPYVLLPPNSYLQSANYGQGIIHKLISVAGPHFGSHMAVVTLDPSNVCSWLAEAATGNYPLNAANFATSATSGGALDLTGDAQGNCVSPALNTLQGTADKRIPMALIGGEMSDAQLNGINSSLIALAVKLALSVKAVQLACGTDYMMQDYNSTGWLTMTNTTTANQSDAFVTNASALNGMGGACTVQNGQTLTAPCNLSLIQYAVHGAGTTSQLGFPEPQMLDDPTVPMLTINLLNAQVNSPVFTTLPSYKFNQVGGCK